MAEEQLSDFFLDEPVAPLLSDPVYALMAEEADEGEEFDDDHIPELAVREQINLKRQMDTRLSAPESVASDPSSSINYMVRRTAKRLVTMLKTGQITWADAFDKLRQLGVDESEFADLLSE